MASSSHITLLGAVEHVWFRTCSKNAFLLAGSWFLCSNIALVRRSEDAEMLVIAGNEAHHWYSNVFFRMLLFESAASEAGQA